VLAAALAAQACAAAPGLAEVRFSEPVEHRVGGPPALLTAASSSVGDERATVAFVIPGPALVMLHTDATGRVVDGETADLPEERVGLALADVDGDGAPEALVVRPAAAAVTVYRRQGDALVPVRDIPAGPEPGRPAAGDLDGDGRLDLVMSINGELPAGGQARYVRLMGDGGGGFGPAQPIALPPAFAGMFLKAPALADLDGDGDLDLVVSGFVRPEPGVGPVATLLNDGTGAFGAASVLAGAAILGGVGEVTGDGRTDVVLAGFKSRSSAEVPPSDPFGALLLVGDGAGGAAPGPAVGASDTVLTGVAQMDGAGPDDLLLAGVPHRGATPPRLALAVARGGGDFARPLTLPVPDEMLGFAAADLNGDGATDLVYVDGPGSDALAFRFSLPVATGSLEFGEVAVGAGDERALVIRNAGAAPLPLGTAALAGPAPGDFALGEDGCSGRMLPPDGSCELRVRFRPAGAGERLATVAFGREGAERPFALSGIGLRTPGPAAGEPRCLPPFPPPAPLGAGGPVAATGAELRINLRIARAAIRRLNAVEAWLAAGVRAGDLCGGAIGAAKLAGGIATAESAAAREERGFPEPRPVAVKPPRGGTRAVRLTAAQLRIDRRTSRAAILRAAALERRLDGGLTGGDLAAGAVTRAALAPRLRILAAVPAAAEPAPSRTETAALRPGGGAGLRTAAAQLRANRRVATAAVRRANALVARLEAGLTGDAFADGSITPRNLAAGVVRPAPAGG
jgi:hypothetical protein